MTAFNPEPHILLMVRHSTESGRPAPNAACLAGAWPCPAESTLPIITSSMEFKSTLVSSKTALIAVDPNLDADTEDRFP